MLCDYRRWLEYDSVALAVLFVGVGLVELIVLSICGCAFARMTKARPRTAKPYCSGRKSDPSKNSRLRTPRLRTLVRKFH